MRIKTFKKEEYRGCPVYFRNFQRHFEYLTVIKGEIYTTHITVNPTFINLLLYWFGFQERYSNQQYQIILKQLRYMAQTTIDTILDKNKKK